MPRQYTSVLRAEQARRTRLAIIEAAFELFLDKGYADTSIRRIAQAAGVSERTVYVVFKDKTSILSAIADHAYYGGAEPGEGEAAFLSSLAAAPDHHERLRLVIHRTALGLEKGLAALARMVMAAAQSDARLESWIAELIERRHQDIRATAEAVLGHELPQTDSVEQMIDEIEAITSEEVYWILVEERGWSRTKYEGYLVDMCLYAMKRHGVEFD